MICFRVVRTIVVVGGWFVAALAARGAAKEIFAGVDDRWRLYRSPHFELFSHIGDIDSRDLLYRLEMLRAIFFDVNRLAEREPLEVTLYAFDSRRDFDAYRPANLKGVTGLYIARPDRAAVMFAPVEDSTEARRVIFHEYIHHLTHVGGMRPPMWLSEGLAELFSTIELRSDSVVFGRPVPGHVAALLNQELIPLQALLNAEQAQVFAGGEEHSGLFYSESWALLHYWYFGAGKRPESVFGLVHRMMVSPDAVPAAEVPRAFKEATGEDFSGMEAKLREYVRTGHYAARKVAPPKIPGKETYRAEKVARAEIRLRLAELALRSTRDPRGKFAMLEALSGPGRLRALEVLGSDASTEGDNSEALERWRQALDEGSQNPAVFHQVGLIESRNWFSQFDYYFRLPAERAERLRHLLTRSIEVAPDQSDAYEMLAWVEAAAPKPSIRNVNLVQSHFPTLRHQDRALIGLAMVRVRLNDLDAARQMLGDVERFSPEPAAREAVKEILRKIAPASDGEPKSTTNDVSVAPPSTRAPVPVPKLKLKLAPPVPRQS
ncbi:MAG: hypothetical protein HYV96_15280 [Opitutae bacterium]|nr:hypothetical protein [Opitutae bacterium]